METSYASRYATQEEPAVITTDTELLPRVLAHYHLTAPLIDQSFAGAPVVYRNYPQGIEQPGDFKVTSFALTANKLLWLVHAKHAIEFYTWAPLLQDDDRLRFARILLESPPGVGYERLKRAALALRVLLHDLAKLEAIPLLDGGGGISLWIPFADAPHATPLRAWLHALANRAAVLYPDLISTEFNTHKDGRVHLQVSSNAPGQYSAVPYSLRAQGMRVCTPVHWNELDRFRGADAFHAEGIPARLHSYGDVFAAEYARLSHQRFASVPVIGGSDGTAPRQTRSEFMWTPAPRGHIITAAVEILGDGKARTSQEILTEALRRKLVPPNTLNKYVYTALIEYIARQIGRGRKPPIVQDAQKRFRINEPLDDWPDLAPLPQRPMDEAAQALCDRLEATASGTNDPTAFENAVCDAFAHLGFLTQHMGQRGQPDGIADAILGPLGYRVLIECKTAVSRNGIVPKPDPMEVAKLRDIYRADKCLMVAPQWPDDIEFIKEMTVHQVTSMAVPELQTLLHMAANPLEVQRVLQPGYAFDVISDMLWERTHGAAKHVATTAMLIQREGWKAQIIAAQQGGTVDAPQLTVDAAQFFVNGALRAAGALQPCTKEEVEEAFAWLSSPNVNLAVRNGDSLVILTPTNLSP